MLDDNNALAAARNAYAYAPFRLERAEATEEGTAVLWGQSVVIKGPASADAASFAAHSSWALDQHHHRLLRSTADEDVLLGVASVTFWGFAQGAKRRFTTARALSRAKQVAGLGKRGCDTASEIVQKTRRISLLLDSNDRQLAIREAMTLKHHGLAFASKLLAFAAPDTNCVYDEVISLRLQSSEDPRLSRLHVPTIGAFRVTEKAAAYDGWAVLCEAKAKELNDADVRWVDWDGQLRPWRAVDVERAFFGLGRP